MFSFCAGVRFGLLFENTPCPLPSLFSLEWFTLPRHSIFPTLPPKSEASRLSVAHSLQHAPTHGPITDHFRAQQPRLSTDSSQGTHCRFPAGCSTCARERGCLQPLGSYSKQLREFPSCWSRAGHKIPNTCWGGVEPLH